MTLIRFFYLSQAYFAESCIDVECAGMIFDDESATVYDITLLPNESQSFTLTVPTGGVSIPAEVVVDLKDVNTLESISVSSNLEPVVEPQTLSGKITYDLVPQRISGSGTALDYNNITAESVRGATVELMDSSGTVISSTSTDSQGNYSFDVSENQMVQVRVKAELLRSGIPSWDVKVVDNTSSDAIYTLVGSLASTGSVSSIRDLHAPSGWGGTSYSSTRAAAPFAILDFVYQSVQKVVGVDATVVMPELIVNWSENNVAVVGFCFTRPDRYLILF